MVRVRQALAVLVGCGAAMLRLAAGDPARAEEPVAVSAPGLGYIVTIGGFADLEPRFEGARHSRWGFQPVFDVRKEGSREWLNLPRDGVDIALWETDNFRAGPVASGRWERDVGSLVRGFRHVGVVNLSIEAGGFVEYWPSNLLRTRLEVRDAVVGAAGVISDASADIVLRPDRQWTITGGPRLSLADATFMRSYYSVSPQQSVTSGLPAYTARPGVRSGGAGSMLKYKWSDEISSMAFVEYQRIAASAFESPLISQRGTPNQTIVGIGMSFSFVTGR